jgi:hypothetical protein
MSFVPFMTPTRAAAYLGCATLLGAWLASAAGVGSPPPPPSEPQPVQTSGTETLAEEVQSQAARLRERLAAAPAPRDPGRNPFAFAPKIVSSARARRAAAALPPVAPPPVFPEPALSLVGIAADGVATAPVRTAIITAEGGEMFMVKAGDLIGGRYRVESVGTDTVELLDHTSGAIRRLALR